MGSEWIQKTQVLQTKKKDEDMAEKALITIGDKQYELPIIIGSENEKAIVASIEGDKAPALKVGDVVVQIDPRYYRPTEVETLLGDPTKAKEKLGWVPEITLDQMIVEMVANDLDQARQHALLQKHGYSVAVGKEN